MWGRRLHRVGPEATQAAGIDGQICLWGGHESLEEQGGQALHHGRLGSRSQGGQHRVEPLPSGADRIRETVRRRLFHHLAKAVEPLARLAAVQPAGERPGDVLDNLVRARPGWFVRRQRRHERALRQRRRDPVAENREQPRRVPLIRLVRPRQGGLEQVVRLSLGHPAREDGQRRSICLRSRRSRRPHDPVPRLECLSIRQPLRRRCQPQPDLRALFLVFGRDECVEDRVPGDLRAGRGPIEL